MIRSDKRCKGCGACSYACPTNAIEMTADEYGFSYPKVNRDLCIDCGKCDSVCLIDNKTLLARDEIENYYAACLKNPKELLNVSSGGVFWALANQVINNNGIVYGASAVAAGIVEHKRAETLEEVLDMRKSKYLVSSLMGVFEDLKRDVAGGRIILFSGLPCQIAAIYSCLGYRPDNLITCEVVCHGCPSPLAFNSFLGEIEKEKNSSVTGIDFRDKTAKWKHNQYAISFSDGSVEKQSILINPYHKAYLDGLILRECCVSCEFSGLPRIADITLADFWLYRGDLLKKSEENGVSLVVCTGKRGRELVEGSQDMLFIEEANRELAIKSCYHLTHPPKRNVFRNLFLKNVSRYGLTYAGKRYTRLHSFIARNLQRAMSWL
ncbi:MAG: Coenzyme F420 hydrogenase/dehydrogenase, beta subunit C-terminal domain [Lachnospiraceae bacterium]|nr:Coenzyme F420 hydrogenase/dehydrogenase, beta subunit C-terminal domain [Lachnospiraceae bacterium]